MDVNENKFFKPVFSGHDSFQCRQFWLKKGFDFVVNGNSFNDDSSVVNLGVGKNMVASIRFWLKAFGITDINDKRTPFGISLLGDNGFDPFLEDEGSIWLLHYNLVKKNYASIYSLIFNEYRREKIEFNRESFVSFLKRKAETNNAINFNAKTLADDFDVFRKMYLVSGNDKSKDESFSGLLADLNLVKKIDVTNDKKREDFFIIENSNKEGIPLEIFLFSILDNSNFGMSINLNNLENDYNSPGSIFALSKQGIIDKIEDAQKRYKWISFNDQAGIKELQFKEKPHPFTILQEYYEQD